MPKRLTQTKTPNSPETGRRLIGIPARRQPMRDVTLELLSLSHSSPRYFNKMQRKCPDARHASVARLQPCRPWRDTPILVLRGRLSVGN